MQKPTNETSSYDFSSHSSEYEESLGKSHKYFIKVKCDALLSSLKQTGHQPERVLDTGCGTGEAEEYLAGIFPQITGIDASPGMIEQARGKKLKGCEFQPADALNLPFKNESFDCVFSFCMYHHISTDKWLTALRESSRVTKKGGFIYIFEHNPANPLTRRIVAKSPVDKGVTLLSPKTVEDLYHQADLDIIDKKFILFFPAFLSSLMFFEKLIGKIPYGGQYFIAGKKET